MEDILIQILIEHGYSEYEAIGMLGKYLEEEADKYIKATKALKESSWS